MIVEKHPFCTGCSACFNICPHGAIRWQRDSEGFFSPRVVKELCRGCNVCSAVCPIYNTPSVFLPKTSRIFIAANTSREELLQSSSGAIFPILAHAILEQKGTIYGAAWTSKFMLTHKRITQKKYLQSLRGSKYIQSNLGHCFSRVHFDLNKGKHVLFSGTPCQVAGLKSYLSYNNVDLQKLLTVEVICRGVASPGFFMRWLEEKRESVPFITLSFRPQEAGWQHSYKMAFFDERQQLISGENCWEDLFYRAYLENRISRVSCGKCLYARPERCADITIGDFDHNAFEANRFPQEGVSIVLLNSAKGKRFLPILQNHAKIMPTSWEKCTYNRPLFEPAYSHPGRQGILQMPRNRKPLLPRLENELFHVGILGIVRADNFGTMLHSYALTKAVAKLGYIPEHINFYNVKPPVEPAFAAFRAKYLPLSPYCATRSDLVPLNYRMHRIIVGSDTLWMNIRQADVQANMLDWAWGHKCLTSYATSFGHDNYSASLSRETASSLLQRFDLISVREDTGLKILAEMGIQAEQVLDPTLLYTSKFYDAIIEADRAQRITSKPYVFTLFYHRNNAMRVATGAAKLLNGKYPVINGMHDAMGRMRSIGELLALVKHAKYVVTDSYHFTIFALLYKKYFLSVMPTDYKDGGARIPSLHRLLGLGTNKICTSLEEITEDRLMACLDYEDIETILENERKKSWAFLARSLALPIAWKEKLDNPAILAGRTPKHVALMQECCNKALQLAREVDGCADVQKKLEQVLHSISRHH